MGTYIICSKNRSHWMQRFIIEKPTLLEDPWVSFEFFLISKRVTSWAFAKWHYNAWLGWLLLVVIAAILAIFPAIILHTTVTATISPVPTDS